MTKDAHAHAWKRIAPASRDLAANDSGTRPLDCPVGNAGLDGIVARIEERCRVDERCGRRLVEHGRRRHCVVHGLVGDLEPRLERRFPIFGGKERLEALDLLVLLLEKEAVIGGRAVSDLLNGLQVGEIPPLKIHLRVTIRGGERRVDVVAAAGGPEMTRVVALPGRGVRERLRQGMDVYRDGFPSRLPPLVQANSGTRDIDTLRQRAVDVETK